MDVIIEKKLMGQNYKFSDHISVPKLKENQSHRAILVLDKNKLNDSKFKIMKGIAFTPCVMLSLTCSRNLFWGSSYKKKMFLHGIKEIR